MSEEVVGPRNDNKENRERGAETARKETTESDGQVLRVVMAPSQQTKQRCNSSESGRPVQHVTKRVVQNVNKQHHIRKDFTSAVASRLESNDIATRSHPLTPSVVPLPSYQELTGQPIFIAKENPFFASPSPLIPIPPLHCAKAAPLAAANLPLQPPSRSLSTTSVPLQQQQPPAASNLTPSSELFIPNSNSSSYFQPIESASVSRQNQGNSFRVGFLKQIMLSFSPNRHVAFEFLLLFYVTRFLHFFIRNIEYALFQTKCQLLSCTHSLSTPQRCSRARGRKCRIGVSLPLRSSSRLPISQRRNRSPSRCFSKCRLDSSEMLHLALR